MKACAQVLLVSTVALQEKHIVEGHKERAMENSMQHDEGPIDNIMRLLRFLGWHSVGFRVLGV